MAGLLLGMGLYAGTRERPVVAAAVIGSVLPDLLDTPLGSLITGTHWYGRIYAHTLPSFLVLLLTGLVIERIYSPRAGLLSGTLAAGVLSPICSMRYGVYVLHGTGCSSGRSPRLMRISRSSARFMYDGE
ncbi:MAG: hypothetical protein A4E42_01402 [Methanoregulaceae archaeon PtaU1.Bin222]|nr:MAG: hypothetical protein A4E42_01402 [Methanoregulaceae archaeon PtaU1.Bin222]